MAIDLADSTAHQATVEFNQPLHEAMFSQLSHLAALRQRAFQALHEELKGTGQKEDSLRVFEREGVGYALLQDTSTGLVVWKIQEGQKPKIAAEFKTEHPIERTDFIPAYDTDYILVRVTDPKYSYREYMSRFDSALQQYQESGVISLRPYDNAIASSK